MLSRDLFLLLSNSKYMGQSTCDMMAKESLLSYIKSDKCTYKEEKKQELLELIGNRDQLEDYYRLMKSKDVELIKLTTDGIYRPPSYVYKLGNGSLDPKGVAVIGSRNCTPYGKKVAYEISYALASQNINVVSGLAYGIDYMAHKGACDASGPTTAIMGSGILNCYPQMHQKMYKRIMQEGLVLSEYGFHGKPLKHHFPFRNRLIAGLSKVIVVVEAKERSGTMITVQCGLDQGKSVVAVPGSVHSPLSAGTHRLIQSGAKLYTIIDDIIDELNYF